MVLCVRIERRGICFRMARHERLAMAPIPFESVSQKVALRRRRRPATAMETPEGGKDPARVRGALRPSAPEHRHGRRARQLADRDDASALFLAQELALRHTPCRLLLGQLLPPNGILTFSS